ncbi:MAG: hypothetical protein LBQ46_13040 [Treponema sp.]|jgi:hypothetical protein|nr:hypothetical protein [Treponema sp.]
MTNESKQKLEHEDIKLNPRIILTGLWTALVLLYISANILSFSWAGYISEIIPGFMEDKLT